MARECIYGDETEDGSESIVVCHHCGSPVCNEHSLIIIDDVFGSSAESRSSAVHCKDCKARYHPGAEVIRALPVGLEPIRP